MCQEEQLVSAGPSVEEHLSTSYGAKIKENNDRTLLFTVLNFSKMGFFFSDPITYFVYLDNAL